MGRRPSSGLSTSLASPTFSWSSVPVLYLNRCKAYPSFYITGLWYYLSRHFSAGCEFSEEFLPVQQGIRLQLFASDEIQEGQPFKKLV